MPRKLSSQTCFTYLPFVILLFILPVFPVYGQTTHVVPGDFATIQEAVDAAMDGDVVVVNPGTYSNFAYKGKNITVRSTNPLDPATVQATIVDGGMSGRCVLFDGTETAECELRGLTITRGASSSGGGVVGNGTLATISYNMITTNTVFLNPIADNNFGAGILDCDGIIEHNLIAGNAGTKYAGGLALCDGFIRNNVIERNTAVEFGGGIYSCGGDITDNIIRNNDATRQAGGGIYSCSGTISGNTIVDNTAVHGAGISNCTGLIEKNLVMNNVAQSFGGGIYQSYGGITNNIVVNNRAGSRGGGLASCQGNIYNNTIYGNESVVGGGGVWGASPATIQNCIIWGNTPDDIASSYPPTYSCVGVGDVGGACIDSNPAFVDSTGGDYHLVKSSACIDAGRNIQGLTEDFEGNPRPYFSGFGGSGDGSGFDMGAYELQEPIGTVVGWMAY